MGWTQTWHHSGALGQVQGDAIREIHGGTGSVVQHAAPIAAFGVFYVQAMWGDAFGGGAGMENTFGGNAGFSASRVVPTAPENRPANMAVRYLMKARM